MAELCLDPEKLISHDLFAGLTPEAIAGFIDCFERETYAEGETIIGEGESGNRLYLVENGRCEVLKRVLIKEGIEQQRIAVLHPGETFGEMELVDRQPRSATIRAMEEVSVLALSAIHLYERTCSDYKTFSIILLNLAREVSLRLRATDMWLAGSLFSIKQLQKPASK